MVSIKWCLKQKDGLEFIGPNSAMADSYIKMAEESINILKGVEPSKIWTATTTYYIFYYSLYSLMLMIGIKCEIHSCSIKFMKNYLKDFYNKKDFDMFEKAFLARINLQYYANRAVDGISIEEAKMYCREFYVKTKDILASINEEQIKSIGNSLMKELNYKKKDY